MDDRDKAGNTPRGERQRNHKTTAMQVREIRYLYTQGGVTQEQLAKKFRLDQTTISLITTGKSWKQLGANPQIGEV